MATIPVGLQLYTLRENMAEDYVGTLKKVAALGYKTVEFAGYGGISAKEMKKILDDLGLKGVSSHVSFQSLQDEPNRQIEYSLEIESDYIICPYLDREEQLQGSGYDKTIVALHNIGEQCTRQGLQ